MRLVVITPTEVTVDQEVGHVRAEDLSGSFGIASGHADLLTTLEICVIRWRNQQDIEHYVAVRGGVLRVSGGRLVEVATREAIVSEDLGQLRDRILVAMRKNREAELSARAGALRLEHAAIREIHRYLRPTDQPLRIRPAK
ncbi:MAG TPA: F0F1 ATP synthase subunit epsilon [Candidatus Binatia bacterium]